MFNIEYEFYLLVSSRMSEAEFQLRRILSQEIDALDYHQWPLENSRRNELIVSLLLNIIDTNQNSVRPAIERLDEMGLLDVDALAQVIEKSRIDWELSIVKHLLTIFSDFGFTEEQSRNSIVTITEFSKSLKNNNDGKLQKYLRKYGNQMITEIGQQFSFSKMNNEAVKNAFALWLQNVLNMPVTSNDKHIKEFCPQIQY